MKADINGQLHGSTVNYWDLPVLTCVYSKQDKRVATFLYNFGGSKQKETKIRHTVLLCAM